MTQNSSPASRPSHRGSNRPVTFHADVPDEKFRIGEHAVTACERHFQKLCCSSSQMPLQSRHLQKPDTSVRICRGSVPSVLHRNRQLRISGGLRIHGGDAGRHTSPKPEQRVRRQRATWSPMMLNLPKHTHRGLVLSGSTQRFGLRGHPQDRYAKALDAACNANRQSGSFFAAIAASAAL